MMRNPKDGYGLSNVRIEDLLPLISPKAARGQKQPYVYWTKRAFVSPRLCASALVGPPTGGYAFCLFDRDDQIRYP